MKTRLPSLIVATLVLTASPLIRAAAAETPAKAFRVTAIEQHNQAAIERGASEFTVRRVLGEPRRTLDRNTWVYERYSSSNWKIDTGDCSMLVITFAEGRITDILLVNERAQKNIAANLQKSGAPIAVATK